MPEFIYMVLACQQHLNFLNCPVFKNTSLCHKMYKFVQQTDNCILKYESRKFMQQEFWFFKEMPEESDEIECLVWQLF